MNDCDMILGQLRTPSNVWVERMFGLAVEVSSWSKLPSKVGAVLSSPDKKHIFMGYNGFPKNTYDTSERTQNQTYKDFHTIHAEINALLKAPNETTGWSMFTTRFPCAHCANMIIQKEVGSIYTPRPSPSSRWAESCEAARGILDEAGVDIFFVEVKDGQ